MADVRTAPAMYPPATTRPAAAGRDRGTIEQARRPPFLGYIDLHPVRPSADVLTHARLGEGRVVEDKQIVAGNLPGGTWEWRTLSHLPANKIAAIISTRAGSRSPGRRRVVDSLPVCLHRLRPGPRPWYVRLHRQDKAGGPLPTMPCGSGGLSARSCVAGVGEVAASVSPVVGTRRAPHGCCGW